GAPGRRSTWSLTPGATSTRSPAVTRSSMPPPRTRRLPGVPPAAIMLPSTSDSNNAVGVARMPRVNKAIELLAHGQPIYYETPDAVRAVVEATRYPFHTSGVGPALGVGRRGHGGQEHAARVWGLAVDRYLATADPWPLNPRGELLLGLKIENVRALASVEASTRVPGIAFAEWGPGDMGLAMGYPDQHDEPYPADMDAARARVLGACKAAGLAFLEQVTPANVLARIAEGVRIGTGRQGPEAAALSRPHTRRTMPW